MFYDRTYNNQCRESEAPRVVDKDRANFCEYFGPATGIRKPVRGSFDARAKLDVLFKKKT